MILRSPSENEKGDVAASCFRSPFRLTGKGRDRAARDRNHHPYLRPSPSRGRKLTLCRWSACLWVWQQRPSKFSKEARRTRRFR